MTAEQLELASRSLGALPILSAFFDRLGLEQVLERHLGEEDPRVLMAVARTIKVLVLNLCVEREPLYGIAEWAARFEAGTLSLQPGEVALLCDDRIGRALDRLFDADRGSLLAELALRAVKEFDVTARSCTTTRPLSPCTASTCRPTGASAAVSRQPPPSAATTRSIAAI